MNEAIPTINATEAEIAAFLLDLTELSKRHGLLIWGCGCCGSPVVEKVRNPDKHRDGHYETSYCGHDLEWVDNHGSPGP